MATPGEIAAAFSDHRFEETFDQLAHGIRWVSVGGPTLVGRTEVITACEEALDYMARLTLDRRRFLVVEGDDTAAVDTLTRYVDHEGRVSTVASCDVYEFTDGRVTAITSYAVEVADPDAPAHPA